MFKKVISTLSKWLPNILLIVLFSMWAIEYSKAVKTGVEIKWLEYLLYATLGIIFYSFYNKVRKHIKRRSIKFMLAIATSTTYTAVVWLLNSYWLCLEINSSLPFKFSYFNILISNLTYSHAYGWTRFPIAFLIMLSLCLFIPWLCQKFERIINRILYFCLAEEETTATKVKDYLYHKNALQVWCIEMEKTVEFKEELKQYAFKADEMLLYELLLAHFFEQMTDEECDAVIEKYERFLIIQPNQPTGEEEGSENS